MQQRHQRRPKASASAGAHPGNRLEDGVVLAAPEWVQQDVLQLGGAWAVRHQARRVRDRQQRQEHPRCCKRDIVQALHALRASHARRMWRVTKDVLVLAAVALVVGQTRNLSISIYFMLSKFSTS